MRMMNMTTKQILVVSVVVGLVIGLFWLLVLHKEVPVPVVENNGTILAVSDQKVDTVIRVQKVQMKTAGFVVIHKSINDFPVDIVGFSEYLTQGVHKNVKIPIQDEVTKGMKLIALIHEDNGDKIFKPADDFSVLNEQKKPFEAPFVAK